MPEKDNAMDKGPRAMDICFNSTWVSVKFKEATC